MANAEDTPRTSTVAVYGLGFWGCGNTYNEACENARLATGFRKAKDYHRLFLFTKPVINVSGDWDGIRWEWSDIEGEVVHADINDKEEGR